MFPHSAEDTHLPGTVFWDIPTFIWEARLSVEMGVGQLRLLPTQAGNEGSPAPTWPILLLLAGPQVPLSDDGPWGPSHEGLVQGQTILRRVPDLKEVSAAKPRAAFLSSTVRAAAITAPLSGTLSLSLSLRQHLEARGEETQEGKGSWPLTPLEQIPPAVAEFRGVCVCRPLVAIRGPHPSTEPPVMAALKTQFSRQ